MTTQAQKRQNLRISDIKALNAAVLCLVFVLFSVPAGAQSIFSAESNDTLLYTRTDATAHDTEANILPETDERLIFTVKKNIIYDVASAINVEAEIPMFNRWSLLLEYVFPWWETGNKYCLEMQEFGPEVRFWLDRWESESKEKMQGWFGGLYLMSAKYDFQLDTKINYQGEYYSAGISAGYVYPIKKIGHRPTSARFEFSIAAGFLQTDFRHYLPTDDYSVLIRDKYNVGRVSYIGPTKVKISFVIPFFAKNNN